MTVGDLVSVNILEVLVNKQNVLMKFDPATGDPEPYPSHAEQWREHHGEMTAWLFNPWLGTRRCATDVGSDPFGYCIQAPAEGLVADVAQEKKPVKPIRNRLEKRKDKGVESGGAVEFVVLLSWAVNYVERTISELEQCHTDKHGRIPEAEVRDEVTEARNSLALVEDAWGGVESFLDLGIPGARLGQSAQQESAPAVGIPATVSNMLCECAERLGRDRAGEIGIDLRVWKRLLANVPRALVVVFTDAELQSGHTRLDWAEGLIRQLPADHDGRNSWLLNYGVSAEAEQIRTDHKNGGERPASTSADESAKPRFSEFGRHEVRAAPSDEEVEDVVAAFAQPDPGIVARAHEMVHGCSSGRVLTEENAGRKIGDMLMECAERLGNFPFARVDERAWKHLLVYCPVHAVAFKREWHELLLEGVDALNSEQGVRFESEADAKRMMEWTGRVCRLTASAGDPVEAMSLKVMDFSWPEFVGGQPLEPGSGADDEGVAAPEAVGTDVTPWRDYLSWAIWFVEGSVIRMETLMEKSPDGHGFSAEKIESIIEEARQWLEGARAAVAEQNKPARVDGWPSGESLLTPAREFYARAFLHPYGPKTAGAAVERYHELEREVHRLQVLLAQAICRLGGIFTVTQKEQEECKGAAWYMDSRVDKSDGSVTYRAWPVNAPRPNEWLRDRHPGAA